MSVIVGQNYTNTALDTTPFTISSTNVDFTNNAYRIYGGGRSGGSRGKSWY